MQELSHLDLVFCVDLTASMQSFIRAAQRHMVAILSSLASTNQADLRVGVCGYRDYSELETTTQCFPLNSDLQTTQSVLQQLQAYSPADNGDAAEAVFAGLLECVEMDWREHAYRIVILVGDAPPHGCGADSQPYPDRWPQQDPTGLSMTQICARVEGNGITLFTLSMSPSVIPVHDKIMLDVFDRLARSTGGIHRDACSAKGAIELFEEISRRVFRNLDVDRAMWERFFQPSLAAPGKPPAAAPSLAAMALEFGMSEEEISGSVSRLKRRKLRDS
ncbi:VWA domain-containing protein [bacterium]|nr:VWA domain-containing protein [bacterium]